MNTNTVQLVEAVGNKMDQYLQALAEKAGVAVDHFYPILVSQQRSEGITTLIAFVLVLAVFSYFVSFALSQDRRMRKLASHGENDFGAAEGKYTVGVVVSIIAGIFLFLSAVQVPSSIMKIANPEYYAIQSLVTMIK